MERRGQKSGVEVRNSGDSVEIVGYSAVFNQSIDILGFFTESIAPEAFNSVLQEGQDTKALFDHESRLILGRVGNGTLSMRTDNQGLYSTIRPNMSVSYAKDLVESIKRGDVSGQSFAFSVGAETWDFTDGETPHRTITEISNLYDVGPVTYPAYPQTSVAVAGLRSLMAEAGELRSCAGLMFRASDSVGVVECRGQNYLAGGSIEQIKAYIEEQRVAIRRSKMSAAKRKISLLERSEVFSI